MTITISHETQATLGQTRKLLIAWKEPSPQTCERYHRYIRSLARRGVHPPDDIGQSQCSRTFYFKRAAYIFCIHMALHQHWQHVHRAIEAEDQAALEHDLKWLRYWLGQLDKFSTDPEFLSKHSGLPGQWKLLTVNDKTPRVKRRESKKRTSLHGKPENWRLQIWQKAQASKYKDAIAVMALSGCRPSELEKGVGLQYLSDGNLLLVIHGSKVTDHSGQEMRSIGFTTDSAFGLYARTAHAFSLFSAFCLCRSAGAS